MTRDEFINSEISTWGIDYICDLFDKGYEVVALATLDGLTKWSWVMPLTQARSCATVEAGSSAGLLPFPRESRL